LELHAADLRQEIEMPVFAPHLAVGDAHEPGILLHLRDLGDAFVFDLAQRFLGDVLAQRLVARLLQTRRPKQAAYVVGTKRSAECPRHGVLPVCLPSWLAGNSRHPRGGLRTARAPSIENFPRGHGWARSPAGAGTFASGSGYPLSELRGN